MRAAVFEGVGRPLAIRTLPDPTPGPGQVLIKVHRCGVCGSDLHMTESHEAAFPVGVVPGHELAGEVVALGRGVEGLKVGDRVTSETVFSCGRCEACQAGYILGCTEMRGLMGGFGEYTVSEAEKCLVLPRTFSMADGAMVEPLACSLHGVLAAGMAPGARVLVLGAGPVGLGAVFWARKLGAGRIAVASHSRRGESLATTLGADAFLDPEADRATAAAEILGGQPDVVFECVGRPGLIAEAVNLVRARGTVAVLSMCTQPDSFFPAAAALKEVQVRFAILYTRKEFEQAADALDAGAVEARAMVTGTIALDQLPEAFEGLRSGSSHCKLMVEPGA